MIGIERLLLCLGLIAIAFARIRLQSSRLFARPDSLSLGAPIARPSSGSFVSPSGLRVDFKVEPLADPVVALEHLVDSIDNELGVLLTSSYEVGL